MNTLGGHHCISTSSRSHLTVGGYNCNPRWTCPTSSPGVSAPTCAASTSTTSVGQTHNKMRQGAQDLPMACGAAEKSCRYHHPLLRAFAIHLLFMNLLASDSFIGQINNKMPNSRNVRIAPASTVFEVDAAQQQRHVWVSHRNRMLVISCFINWQFHFLHVNLCESHRGDK